MTSNEACSWDSGFVQHHAVAGGKDLALHTPCTRMTLQASCICRISMRR